MQVIVYKFCMLNLPIVKNHFDTSFELHHFKYFQLFNIINHRLIYKTI